MLIQCFVAMTSLKYFLSKSVNHLREVTQYIVQRRLLYFVLNENLININCFSLFY